MATRGFLVIFRDVFAPLAFSKTLIQVSSLAGLVGVYSLLPIWKENSSFRDVGDIPSQIHAAMSLTLGWLLVFRTNAAYARWWEARTLWGTLVNASRNLAIKLKCLARASEADSVTLQSWIGEFPTSLMNHLRQPSVSKWNTRSDGGSANSDHRPALIVQQIYEWLAGQKASGRIDGDEMRVIDVELAKLMEVCGACERIARTPVVRSYRIFARQCVLLFLLTLPWGIVSDFGWWTLPLSLLTAYFMIGLEVVAEHVEEPFGFDEDDLDLEGMCETIQGSIKEIFARSAESRP